MAGVEAGEVGKEQISVSPSVAQELPIFKSPGSLIKNAFGGFHPRPTEYLNKRPTKHTFLTRTQVI